MSFDLTKIAASMTALTVWVKAGLAKKADATATTTALGTKADATATTNALATKQSTILTGTAVPDNTVGNNGDVFMVTDT